MIEDAKCTKSHIRNVFGLMTTKRGGDTGMKNLETRYLERLSDLYPTIAAASTEIINLQAILNLPKGTEHFLTDIHGEYEAFNHVLKNGSGSVRRLSLIHI